MDDDEKKARKAEKALNFLVGQVLKKRPKADPVVVRDMMIKSLLRK